MINGVSHPLTLNPEPANSEVLRLSPSSRDLQSIATITHKASITTDLKAERLAKASQNLKLSREKEEREKESKKLVFLFVHPLFSPVLIPVSLSEPSFSMSPLQVQDPLLSTEVDLRSSLHHLPHVQHPLPTLPSPRLNRSIPHDSLQLLSNLQVRVSGSGKELHPTRFETNLEQTLPILLLLPLPLLSLPLLHFFLQLQLQRQRHLRLIPLTLLRSLQLDNSPQVRIRARIRKVASRSALRFRQVR